MRVTEPEATNACQGEQLCARLKSGIDSAIYGVQYIWHTNFSTDDLGFILLDAKDAFNKIN